MKKVTLLVVVLTAAAVLLVGGYALAQSAAPMMLAEATTGGGHGGNHSATKASESHHKMLATEGAAGALMHHTMTRDLQKGRVTLALKPGRKTGEVEMLVKVVNLSWQADPEASVNGYLTAASGNHGVHFRRERAGEFVANVKWPAKPHQLAIRVNRPATSEVVYFGLSLPKSGEKTHHSWKQGAHTEGTHTHGTHAQKSSH